jgi:hypothetical protein
MTNVMYLVHSLFRALIRGTKYIKDQQMHSNFIDVLLFYFGYQHVSAFHVDIFRANFENKNTIVINTCLNHFTVLETVKYIVE